MQGDIQVSAQVVVNTARMEGQHQPATAWPVYMVTQTCPCRFVLKFAFCMLSISARQTRARIDGNDDEVLVNRRKRKAMGTPPTIGRPVALDVRLTESKDQMVLSTQVTIKSRYNCQVSVT
ncbi:hypothetical protein GQ600_16651 [Phytophthora cactorum]|nr:hypothetical protein GQ600_16651 [Phytophthora cactorum]